MGRTKAKKATRTAPGEGSLAWAGRRMGISPHTVRALVRQKALAHYRVGRRIVVLDADIDAFMARRRVPAQAQAPRSA